MKSNPTIPSNSEEVQKDKAIEKEINRLVTECNHRDLTYAIQQTIKNFDSQHYTISDDTNAWMTRALAEFVEEAILKFIKGQKEHGGNLLDRDCFAEMGPELKDFFWYYMGAKEKKKHDTR